MCRSKRVGKAVQHLRGQAPEPHQHQPAVRQGGEAAAHGDARLLREDGGAGGQQQRTHR